MNKLDRKLSIAPMMDYTDRHFRYFMRLLSKRVLLYTEMVTSKAIIHGDLEYILGKDNSEAPIAIQIAGNDPQELAECVKPIEDYGYDEINLNIGCPSERVSSGSFGACLMKEPDLVAECVAALKSKTTLPVTVKTRIGVDDYDSYEFLNQFVKKQVEAGADALIVHARKALLKGLSPKENREIPPLNYARVEALKNDFKSLEIIINGGINSFSDAQEHLKNMDGVMIGREAYRNPYLFARADQVFFEEQAEIISRKEALELFLPYLEQGLAQGLRLHWMVRHITGLFLGVPRAKMFRTLLSEGAREPSAGIEVVVDAMKSMERAAASDSLKE